MTAEILLADNLSLIENVRHGFYTRAWGDGGKGSLPDSDDATANRSAIAETLGVSPPNILSSRQTHSTKVITVAAAWGKKDRPEGDAMVTKEKGLALAILTADCVPLLFVDGKSGVIGAAHAGWRGALGGIIENTLTSMEELGAMRRSIEVALGPCIWQKSYEVGPEFPAPFLAEHETGQRFFQASLKPDHYRFNLPAYVEAKIRRLGVPSVASSPGDTCADETRFYSYRRSTLRGETRAGNLISVIVLA